MTCPSTPHPSCNFGSVGGEEENRSPTYQAGGVGTQSVCPVDKQAPVKTLSSLRMWSVKTLKIQKTDNSF